MSGSGSNNSSSNSTSYYLTYQNVDDKNWRNFLTTNVADIDTDSSNTWYLQGNFDTMATASTVDQLEAIQHGGITKYNITDPQHDSGKTFTWDEAMGTVDTSDIMIKTADVAAAGKEYEESAAKKNDKANWLELGGAGATAIGTLIGAGIGTKINPGIGTAAGAGIGAAIGGIASIFTGIFGASNKKGASDDSAKAAEAQQQAQQAAQEQYNAALVARQTAVRNAWANDVLAGNNADYVIEGAKVDENGNYVSGGTIKQRRKAVSLMNYGGNNVTSSGIGA